MKARSGLFLACALAVALGLVTSVASAAHLGGARRTVALARRVVRASVPVAAPAGAPVGVGQEVPELRTANSRTYFDKQGGFVQQISSGPLNFRDARGGWAPIDNTLVNSSGGYRNAGNGYQVTLPASLASPVQFSRDGASASLQLLGGAGSASVSGATATYAAALPSTTVKLTAANASVKETLTLASRSAPTTFTYALTLSAGLTASASQTSPVVIRDSSGKEVFSLARPFMTDAAGVFSPGTQVSLTGTAPAYTLTVSLDRSWLSASGRSWPVTVDPSWFTTASTFIESGYPSSSFAGWGALYVGYNGTTDGNARALLSFDLSSLPARMQIVHSELTMYQYATAYCTCTGSVDVDQLTRNFTESATWNTSDGTTGWSSAGGDSTGPVATEPVDTTVGWNEWQVDDTARQWYENPSSNHGFLVKASNESTNTKLSEFNSGDATSNVPYLWVTYQPRVGLRSFYGYHQFAVDDHVSGSVNLGNGNLVVASHDATITGVNGFDLDLTHYYNSLDANLDGESNANTTGEVGSHWSFMPECGISWDGSLTYEDPTGWEVQFPSTPSGSWLPVDGMNATPSVDTSQSGFDWLTFNQSGAKAHCQTNGLTSMRDRNGNKFDYYLSGEQLLHIDDATRSQQDVSFTYNPQSLMSQMTDYANRVWQYGYNASSDLTSVTDPGSNTVTYGYDGNHQLTSITDPNGNQTAIGYDTSHRVSTIQQGLDSSGSCPAGATCPITQLSYPASLDSNCTGVSGAVSETIVTDPLGHPTSYCLDNRLRVLKTVDPLGRSHSGTWTANNDGDSATNEATGVSNASYDSNNNLTQAQGPANASGQRQTSTWTYGTGSATYQPNSFTDTQQHQWNAAYDTAGNLCAKSEGTTTTALTCSWTSGSGQGNNGMAFTHNADGTLATANDANGGVTSYGYTSHNLTSITNPSPLGGEAMSYDTLNRLASATDGKSQTTSYAYDGSTIAHSLDRLAKITFAGGQTITYNYDGDGNLQSQVDSAGGTTSYTYDALNRVHTETKPGGTVITYNYDAAGNLTSINENSQATSYQYDHANRLTGITEPGASTQTCPITGITATICLAYPSETSSTITYPGGATVNSSYDTAGRLISLIDKNGAGTTVASYSYTYTYTGGGATQDGSVRQSNTTLSGTSYYCYDPVGRLLTVAATAGCPASSPTYAYSYDANGNMTSKTINGVTTNYTVNAANELTGSGYSYDGNGNMASSPSFSNFTYNTRDQTTSITPTSGSAKSAGYLGRGQFDRTSFASDTFLNDNLGTARRTSGTTNTDYTRTPGGGVYSENVGGTRYYFAFDGLGSVVGLFDSSGSLVSNYIASYEPYGSLIGSTPTGYPSFNIRFAGYWYDTQTGLYKVGARHYDPNLARWTQRDPIDNPYELTGWNRYDYAGDDPTDKFDPSGMGIISFLKKNIPFISTGLECIEGGIVGFELAGPYGAAGGCIVNAAYDTIIYERARRNLGG